MNILVSSCLLGIPARYNGEEIVNNDALALLQKHTLVPVCPEQLGGLPIPREPAEIHSSRVMTRSGKDVTDAYQKGAEATLAIARMFGCTHAIFQKRSPSCGCGKIYDGMFHRKMVDGNGVSAQRLIDAGIIVMDESEAKALL
jgi:Uncharacterized conserved protein